MRLRAEIPKINVNIWSKHEIVNNQLTIGSSSNTSANTVFVLSACHHTAYGVTHGTPRLRHLIGTCLSVRKFKSHRQMAYGWEHFARPQTKHNYKQSTGKPFTYYLSVTFIQFYFVPGFLCTRKATALMGNRSSMYLNYVKIYSRSIIIYVTILYHILEENATVRVINSTWQKVK